MTNVAIFASGNGSNAEKIALHFKDNSRIRVKLIAANTPHAYVLTRANRLHIPTFVFNKAMLETGEVLKTLQKNDIHFIVLAGFLLKITPDLIAAYPRQIINIHPALLPKFGGKGMYGAHVHQAVLKAGEKESGISIHLVNEHYDEGQILFQASCPVSSTDTPESLAEKIHALEYAHYAVVLEQYITSQLS